MKLRTAKKVYVKSYWQTCRYKRCTVRMAANTYLNHVSPCGAIQALIAGRKKHQETLAAIDLENI